ncbi:MAG: hypothetical protein HXS48_11950 [Theionarchaea archaeon]|nr:MAG: hypothetical protein AYK19_05705 [Theionarchaea archaeon DG-70-1]MBU7027639.1 hypothetical protein [Theionarchaea archaeon]
MNEKDPVRGIIYISVGGIMLLLIVVILINCYYCFDSYYLWKGSIFFGGIALALLWLGYKNFKGSE